MLAARGTYVSIRRLRPQGPHREARFVIRFHLFGEVDLRNDGGAPIRSVLVQPKRTALLAYLAAAGSGVFTKRTALLAAFWPDREDARARNALRQALHHLRRSVGSDVVIGRGDEELTVSGEHLWCDVTAFKKALDGDPRAALELRGRGAFMEGCTFDDSLELEHWLTARRASLDREALAAAKRLVDGAAGAGDYEEAARVALAALRINPYDEVMLRQLMRSLASAGSIGGAAAAYREFRQRLARDLDLQPGSETEALWSEISSHGEGAGEGRAVARATHPAPPVVARSAPAAVAPRGASAASKPRWAIRYWAVGVFFVFVAVVATILMSGRPSPPIRSLAVLPITNLTGDESRGPFVDGLTEIMRNEVAHVRDLVVLSGTSVASVDRGAKTVPEIGRELGADALIEAAVTAWGETIELTVRLIRARDDATLWSDAYEVAPSGAWALQRRVAQRVAEAVEVALVPDAGGGLATADSIDGGAFNLYVEGLSHLLRGGPQNAGRRDDMLAHLDTSIALLDSATVLEPGWADAWARLADALGWRGSSRWTPYPAKSRYYLAARDAARRALDLDDRNAVAYRELAWVEAFHDGDHALAEAHWLKAEELDPNGDEWASGVWGYGVFLLFMGRPDSAAVVLERARVRNPLSGRLLAQLGGALACAGRLADADSAFARSRALGHASPEAAEWESLAAIRAGRYADALDELLETYETFGSTSADVAGYAYAKLGREAEARTVIEHLAANGSLAPDTWIGLGEVDRGLAEYRKEFARWRTHPRCQKAWYPDLKDDPRLREILEPVFPGG